MTYFLDLFSPETYEAFGQSDRTVSGFRPRQRNVSRRVKAGDRFLCYMTRLSRWVGVLEVLDGPYSDATPIFQPENDPFTVRFHVRPLVWLDVTKAVPIHDDVVWQRLSFTRNLSKESIAWTGRVRGSLGVIGREDGDFLDELLHTQVTGGRPFPLDQEDRRRLTPPRVRRADRDITVTVPVDAQESTLPAEPVPDIRESLKIQALLADIGSKMGMQIWIPRNDRNAVLSEWRGEHGAPLDRLPLNYDETTLRTIEQIDILWLQGRSIRRAFEVEHTTSVYSGILRMADLLALQPNMDIHLHIVAPEARRSKVFQEIRRPVFSLLERGPLSESCTFISYDSVRELATQPHLAHLSDSVLEEYEEEAED